MCILDREQLRLYYRWMVIGLLAAASSILTGLASFVGQLDVSRVMLFGLAGLVAAAVALLGPPSKKSSQCKQSHRDESGMSLDIARIGVLISGHASDRRP
jgi:hypothetical protein